MHQQSLIDALKKKQELILQELPDYLREQHKALGVMIDMLEHEAETINPATPSTRYWNGRRKSVSKHDLKQRTINFFTERGNEPASMKTILKALDCHAGSFSFVMRTNTDIFEKVERGIYRLKQMPEAATKTEGESDEQQADKAAG